MILPRPLIWYLIKLRFMAHHYHQPIVDIGGRPM